LNYEGYLINKKDIPTYFDDFFWYVYGVWDNYREFKTLPDWLNQPLILINVIKHMENEYNKFQNIKAHQAAKKGHKKDNIAWR
jgi:hypothetical protein